MNEDEFPSGITNNPDVVDAIKSAPIKSISRAYTEFDIERIERIEGSRYSSRENKSFDFLSGAVLIHLENGDVIGFLGNETLESICPWFFMRRGEEVDEVNTWPYVRELAQHMDSADPTYSDSNRWSHMIGQIVTKIKVLVPVGSKDKVFRDYMQKAIVLETSQGDLALTYSLLDLPSSFPLVRFSEVPKDILEKCVILEL